MTRNDAELLQEFARTGASDAFAAVVQRHLGLVYSSALRRLGGDAHRAEDVAQLVFTALARNAEQLSRSPALNAWLYATTRNMAVDVIRAERRRQDREREAMEQMNSESGNPEWDKLRPVLDAAMDRLNAREREVILRRFFGAQPFREIADALKISEDAARMRVDRALEKLRGVLARRGIESTSTALGVLLASEAAAAAPGGLAASATVAATAAVSTAPSVLGTFALMASTSKIVAVGGILALVSVGVAFRETQVLRAAVSASRAQQDTLASEQARLATAEQRKRQLEAELAQRRGAPPAAGQAIQAAGAACAAPGTAQVVASAEREDPEVAAMWAVERAKARLLFTSEWRATVMRALPFLSQLGLSREQLAAFEAMMNAEYGEDSFRDWGKENRGLDWYRAHMRNEWEAKTRALIGDAAFERLQALTDADGRLRSVSDYLARVDLPLAREQALEVHHLLSQREAKLADGTVDWAYIETNAAAVLSSAQLSACKRQRELADFEREVSAEFRRAAAAASNATH